MDVFLQERTFYEVKRLCCAGRPDGLALLGEVIERLRRVVPFEAYCASTKDPATGFITHGMAEETGRMLEAPLVSQLIFVGLLSVNLAVLNVLPFPPLDGGRIAVVLVEAVRRRRLPAEREALIYLTGFMVLIALVILISIIPVYLASKLSSEVGTSGAPGAPPAGTAAAP